jgi:hypothetical protein
MLVLMVTPAGTGFTAQVYSMSNVFLPKEWIMEKWEEGYYITAMAGEFWSSRQLIATAPKGTYHHCC